MPLRMKITRQNVADLPVSSRKNDSQLARLPHAAIL
jgi:hypothetical protein